MEISVVELALGMQSLMTFVVMRIQSGQLIFGVYVIHATVGRVGRTIMTNKDIEEMKRNIDELVEGLKKQEDENARLKATVKSQRDKIDSLLKELEEEKGKTITISDGAITMRADMWEALNENKAFKDENTALKQRIKDLEDVCDGSCFSDETDERNKLIAELQDQHQKDCIKINQLHATIDTLADKYSRLRKTAGVD